MIYHSNGQEPPIQKSDWAFFVVFGFLFTILGASMAAHDLTGGTVPPLVFWSSLIGFLFWAILSGCTIWHWLGQQSYR